MTRDPGQLAWGKLESYNVFMLNVDDVEGVLYRPNVRLEPHEMLEPHTHMLTLMNWVSNLSHMRCLSKSMHVFWCRGGLLYLCAWGAR